MVSQRRSQTDRPLLAVTIGDVAGIGPEILVGAWADEAMHRRSALVAIGSTRALRAQVERSGSEIEVVEVGDPVDAESSPRRIGVIDPGADVSGVDPGTISAEAGRAVYESVVTAADLAMSGRCDGLVTMPLHKESLHEAGYPFPGHTEILAERTGTEQYGMMLYRRGLGVLHVTLHRPLRTVIEGLSTDAVLEKAMLLDTMMHRLGVASPRLGVAALNPHAGDGGLFGDEEERLIAPAVRQARERGIDAVGPIPADTLFVRADRGEFDGVVAMYHDQGHIALKLLGWREAVNITVGLPIVRTSVAHGTGFDIVGRGRADPRSFFEAVDVARRLCDRRAAS